VWKTKTKKHTSLPEEGQQAAFRLGQLGGRGTQLLLLQRSQLAAALPANPAESMKGACVRVRVREEAR
jgi:hypothetical protein